MNSKLLILIVVSIATIAQPSVAQPGDLGTDRTPPSPNAAAIAQYGAVPVNLATGTMSVDIPLFNMESTYLTLPVSVNYMANGIRTHQEASDVGLGWAITAGGVISRTINDGPDDEQGRGYWEVNFDPNDIQSVQNAYLSNWDTEPDLFSYNFMGYSGKFVVTPDMQVKFYEDCKMKFEFLGVDGWRVTDLNGVIYEFQAGETTTTVSDGGGGGSATVAITSWYLTKITHPSLDSITLTYTDGPELDMPQPTSMSQFVSTQEVYGCGSPVCHTTPPQYSDPATVTISTKQLTGISTRYYNMSVYYSTPGIREDITNGEYVDYIEKRTKHNVLIKKIDFDYEYFNPSSDVTGKRLKLKSIQESGPGESLPPFTFAYIDPSNLATKYSYSVDHWGFQNDWAPSVPYLPYPQVPDDIVHFGNSKRQPSNRAMCGMLSQINYPTGLVRKFTYELHNYGFLEDDGNPVTVAQATSVYVNCPGSSGTCIDMRAITIDAAYPSIHVTGSGTCQQWPDCQQTLDILGPNGQSIGPPFAVIPADLPAAGLYVDLPPGIYRVVLTTPSQETAWARIEYVEVIQNPDESEYPKSGGVRIKSITDNDGTRSFSYTLEDGTPSGVLVDVPNYIVPAVHTVSCQFGGGTDNCISCPGMQINSSSYNNMLSGAHVFYTHVKETLQDGGYKEYDYEFAPDDHVSYDIPIVPASSHEQERGQLKKVSIYDSDDKLIQEDENTYSTDLLDWTWAYRIAAPSPQCLTLLTMNSYYHLRTWKRLASSVSKYYGSDGTTPVATTTTYSYSPDSYSVNSETLSSGNVSRSTEYKYAPDLIGMDPLAATMNTKNMIGIPLETIIDGGTGGGSKISYIAQDGMILPARKYTRVAGSNYVAGPEDLTGWKLLAKAYNFDSNGNPGSIKSRANKLAQEYTWDSRGLLITREDEQGVREWDYDYNEARLLSYTSDNAGVVSEFTYDGLWRLETANGNSGRVLHTYNYDYGLISGGENKITDIRSYPVGNQFGLPSMTEEKIFDGFGRGQRTGNSDTHKAITHLYLQNHMIRPAEWIQRQILAKVVLICTSITLMLSMN